MAYRQRDNKAEEVHVFDFDGTIFYSPSVDDAIATTVFTNQLRGGAPARPDDEVEKEAKRLVGSLSNPVSAGGLGWYQSLSSMCPPAVPQSPDLEAWYVKPIVDRIHQLMPLTQQMVQDGAERKRKVVLYVLTGRDVKYTHRIRELLRHAGILDAFDFVFLKPTETAGTTKFKQNKILELIRRHEPHRVFYYDDRLEQGARIFAGLHELQALLYAPADTYRSWCTMTGDKTTADRTDGGDVTSAATDADADVPRLSPHSFSTLCVLSEALPLTGTATSQTASAVAPESCVVAFTDLLHERSDPAKEATRAIRTGRRWAVESIAFLNNRFGTGAGSHASGMPSRASAMDEVLVAEEVHFRVPPLFHLTQVFMPETIRTHSETMLDAQQVQKLIETLQDEKALYDAFTPEERESQMASPPTAGYGYGGRGGRGRGAGARGRGRQGQPTTVERGRGGWARTHSNCDQSFPALPG